jgi:hypothetical protein
MITADDPELTDGRCGAFLLKIIHRSTSTCGPYRMELNDSGMAEHFYVARLAGVPIVDRTLSTTGLKIAVSPGANRIAIAHWKTVKVWALDPDVLLNPIPFDLIHGQEGLVPGDYLHSEGRGWEYYACGEYEEGLVVLEPVELPMCGVVYDLEFTDEDELWGHCDGELVRWSFGARARAKTVVKDLETETEMGEHDEE